MIFMKSSSVKGILSSTSGLGSSSLKKNTYVDMPADSEAELTGQRQPPLWQAELTVADLDEVAFCTTTSMLEWPIAFLIQWLQVPNIIAQKGRQLTNPLA